MATVEVRDQEVTIRMPAWEAVMARRGTVTIARAAVSRVSVTGAWVSEQFGVRHGGLVVSGIKKVGVWLGLDGTRRLLAMRRGVPTLRLWCDPERAEGFSQVLISTPAAYDLAALLIDGVRGDSVRGRDRGSSRPAREHPESGQ